MELQTVESSMIHAVGYDDAAHELEIIFNTGKIYRYIGVPKKMYRELLGADSKGQYMRANIIGAYPDYRFPSRRQRA